MQTTIVTKVPAVKLDRNIQWSIRNSAGTLRTAAFGNLTLIVEDYGQLGYYIRIRDGGETVDAAQMARNANGYYDAPVRNAMTLAESMAKAVAK